jgi:excisionase family DNA binding protein
VSDLARALLDELADDPVALARLRELVGVAAPDRDHGAAAYTSRTLAAELGRTERSIRAAIARGELRAVKRGRGYLIAADAIADWSRASDRGAPIGRSSQRRCSPSGAGPMRRALGT